MESKKKLNLFFFCMMFGLLIGMLFLVKGVWTYRGGFHSVDLGWNMKVINKVNSLGLIGDLMSDYQVRSYEEIIVMGNQQQDYGFVYSLLGALLIGMCWVGVALNKLGNVKEEEGR